MDPSPSDLLKEASIENEVMNETRNIDRLLEMLSTNDARAKDSFSDNEELQNLYNSTLSIRPKLVKLIEKYSLKKGIVSSDFFNTFNTEFSVTLHR